MEKIKVARVKAEVTVNLDTIIKYHPSSNIYLNNRDSNPEYTTEIEIIGVMEKSGAEYIINDAYKYTDIVEKLLPDPSHKFNLLVLVHHLIEIEWGYYKSYTLPTNKAEQDFNEHQQMVALLKQLKVLHKLLENQNIRNIETKIQLQESKSFGDIKKIYDVKGMQVITLDPDENRQIIQFVIANRKQELKGYYQLHLPMVEFDTIVWTEEEIDKLINVIQQPFRDFRALWLFGKLVSEKVLCYLKGELTWDQGDIEITKDQGVIIYTLLAVFQIIDPELEKEHIKKKINDAEKAKYIRSFFRKDLKNADETFYEITINKNLKTINN